MEESYETFEEELWPPRAEPAPLKTVRQTRKPEMYGSRKIREEMPPAPPQPKSEPKVSPRETSVPRSLDEKAAKGLTTDRLQAPPVPTLSPADTPWENVTLNRCLLVAITILVLTSGFQRLNESMRGQRSAEEEAGRLTVRRTGSLRHRGQPLEPETSLWDVMFWWLPDFDDDDDEDDDDDGDEDEGGPKVKIGKSKRGGKAASGLRNKPLPEKKLMKKKDGKVKERKAKKEDEDEEEEEEEEEKEEEAPKKSKKETKGKKKTQKG